jgi:hypothetical protein
MKHNIVKGINFTIKTPALYLIVGLTVVRACLKDIQRLFLQEVKMFKSEYHVQQYKFILSFSKKINN